MAGDKAYQIAEREIEEAQRLGATKLSLRGLGLTELPESLGQLTQLQSLGLFGNSLTSLPECLRGLTQLQWLDLACNQLTALPEWLGQLKRLKALYLTGNRLASLPEWLGQLSQLQALYASSNHLISLPESLSQLTRLQSLYLPMNHLKSLPWWLGRLTQLQSLDLPGNQLESLPESLGQLAQLQSLDLSKNRLISLPESLGRLTHLRSLDLSCNQLTSLPESLEQLMQLRSIDLSKNRLLSLPESLGQLRRLESLKLPGNQLESLPETLGHLMSLKSLDLSDNPLMSLPEALGHQMQLQSLDLSGNQLTSLPPSLGQLNRLQELNLRRNPLAPELAAAYQEGLAAVKKYLRAKAGPQVVLNEAKLILIGEGEVGKSCLLGALRGDEWIDGRPTTHGIDIKPVKVNAPDSRVEITLNGWDFGGQRAYRPTHQLFFSAPAVYLVVWKPREGPQQGFVKEWIKLVKHREPDAKILVVATHGGPGQRQPDVNRQEIWDLFGSDTVLHFLHVDSKPDQATGERRGLNGLKQAIARVAASLPEVGRTVPARWQQAREALKQTRAAYLPLEHVLKICHESGMDEAEARLFVTIFHRLGHLLHYEHDPILRGIVVLKPDWLATAISFVLDDKQTRATHGLVSFARLSHLWNDPAREERFRYPPKLHPIFLRLMERFDLSYRVAGSDQGRPGGTSLIAQLVPDIRPNPIPGWAADAAKGDEQQVQICRIVEIRSGQSAPAEGLFYQLIVRLQKYSLGRSNYEKSVHWQRGLVLDDDYNGQALLEHMGNDIRITVRAPYPERFLSALTYEVKWLVESFWAGLRCDLMVPCLEPCGSGLPGTGQFEVQKLIESKKRDKSEYPCSVCDEWQNIDFLLRNASAVVREPTEKLLMSLTEMRREVSGVRKMLITQNTEMTGLLSKLDIKTRRTLSRVDFTFEKLIKTLIDEAKEGPRLFSFQPVDPGFFDRPKWISQKFRLTLWCEHSRLPLPSLYGEGDSRGVYDLSLPREWFVKAAPFLKVLTGTLSLVLPVASSATKLVLDDGTYKRIDKELDLGQKSIDSVFKGGEKAGSWLGCRDAPDLEYGEAMKAQGAALRELHALLKEKDPSFGGLVRVRNKRQEFFWVHPQFEKEY